MSSVNPTGELTRQLAEFTAKVPDPVALRLRAASEETAASGVAPGLTVSEQAPDFILPNTLGEPVGLAQRLAQGPVVFSFYRGEWCPFATSSSGHCSVIPRFQAYGASLMAISPQAPDHSLSVTQKHGLKFDVLSDVHQRSPRLSGPVHRAGRSQGSAPRGLPQRPIHPHRRWELGPSHSSHLRDRRLRHRTCSLRLGRLHDPDGARRHRSRVRRSQMTESRCRDLPSTQRRQPWTL